MPSFVTHVHTHLNLWVKLFGSTLTKASLIGIRRMFSLLWCGIGAKNRNVYERPIAQYQTHTRASSINALLSPLFALYPCDLPYHGVAQESWTPGHLVLVSEYKAPLTLCNAYRALLEYLPIMMGMSW